MSTTRFLRLLFVLVATAASAAVKPYPQGIIDLPGATSVYSPIGTLADHPWENPNVDGLRIRTGWDNTEPGDNVYNWVQIDECLANALASGKFIGLGVISGFDAPTWLLGGVTFSDGSSTLDVATLTSPTASFVSSDVGKVIDSFNYPSGTTIVSVTSSTEVRTSAAATKTSTTKKPAIFSILARQPGGAVFRVLSDSGGVMPVPWDPKFKAKWKEFIVALGARYDSNPQLQYLVMAGFQQTGECYLAAAQEDIDFFDASAVAAGYEATDLLPAGLVAWEATVKEIVDQYMTSFKNTPLIITGARPYGGPQLVAGQRAMNDIFDWGVTTYPGRFGIMNSQLHVTSTPGYYLNAAILDNHLTEPTGIQFLCNSATDDNVARLSNSPPYGDDPLLSPYDAMSASFDAGIALGVGFIEVYEADVNNPDYQTLLAAKREALGLNPPPSAPTNLRLVP
jgi:hypothetical protein